MTTSVGMHSYDNDGHNCEITAQAKIYESLGCFRIVTRNTKTGATIGDVCFFIDNQKYANAIADAINGATAAKHREAMEMAG